jgi:hypothetical protein
MRILRALPGFAIFVIAAHLSFAFTARPSVDSGECGPDVSSAGTSFKTSVFHDRAHAFRAYGELLVRRDTKAQRCLATYRLWTAREAGPFSVAKSMEFPLDDGQIAGIDLIGFSDDATQFAADFLWAEGDGTIHHPAVLNRSIGQVVDMALDDRIQKRIHGCDQTEDFIGVTNAGEAVFAIPPSIYDDSPECGDKGVWRFNLKTGRVYRVAKISGVKWR